MNRAVIAVLLVLFFVCICHFVDDYRITSTNKFTLFSHMIHGFLTELLSFLVKFGRFNMRVSYYPVLYHVNRINKFTCMLLCCDDSIKLDDIVFLDDKVCLRSLPRYSINYEYSSIYVIRPLFLTTVRSVYKARRGQYE